MAPTSRAPLCAAALLVLLAAARAEDDSKIREEHQKLVEDMFKGEVGAMEQALAAGISPDVEMGEKAGSWTALMYATYRGCSECAQVLVDAGATVDVTRDNGATALMYACEWGKADVAEILIKAGSNVNTITDERVYSEGQLAKMTEQQKQSTNGQSSPLMAAAFSGNEEIIKLLLAAGVDVKHKNQDGRSARDMVVTKGKPELILVLDPLDTIRPEDENICPSQSNCEECTAVGCGWCLGKGICVIDGVRTGCENREDHIGKASGNRQCPGGAPVELTPEEEERAGNVQRMARRHGLAILWRIRCMTCAV